MARSKLPNAVLELGDRLVRELEGESRRDTLARWMAHHLAELIEQAKATDGQKRSAIEKKIVELSIRVWRARGSFPGSAYPLRSWQPVLQGIERLSGGGNPFTAHAQSKRERLLHDAFEGMSAILSLGVVLLSDGPLSESQSDLAAFVLNEDEQMALSMLEHWAGLAKFRALQFGNVRIKIPAEGGSSSRMQDVLPQDAMIMSIERLLKVFGDLKSELTHGTPGKASRSSGERERTGKGSGSGQ